MSYELELKPCRLAIQIRVGRFADGRERQRTFGLKNVNPEAARGKS